MRPSDKVSWTKILSLGAIFACIWLGWAVMPMAFADAIAASLVQVKSSSAPVYTEKDQKHKELEFHAWSSHQLVSYEESEQRHFFLLEKSGFYLSLQNFIESAQAGWIIYRPISRGSSVVWIRTLEPVQKGSAVIIGDCAIGFVDAVSGLCARIRLITDPRARVSVEVRKAKKSRDSETFTNASAERLMSDVSYWKWLASHGVFQGLKGSVELKNLLNELETLLKPKEKNMTSSSNLYGLLRGVPGTWRSQKNRLMAEGFYQEVELNQKPESKKTPIIEAGDLLVTSGLDGRYPAGLRVGYVAKVSAQDPANTLFEVEASLALADFSKEKWVWVLPATTPLDDTIMNTRGI